MRNSGDVESFVRDWVAENMRSLPGQAQLPAEMDRLAAALTGAARLAGISGRDMHRALGDIDDYLTAQYRKACGPEAETPLTAASS